MEIIYNPFLRAKEMNKKFDGELVCSLLKDISKILVTLMKIIPDQDPPILRELAASSIHIAFFARDLFERDLISKNDLEKEFLESCGCKEIIEEKFKK